jgi:PAS domain S-box-containing protein
MLEPVVLITVLSVAGVAVIGMVFTEARGRARARALRAHEAEPGPHGEMPADAQRIVAEYDGQGDFQGINGAIQDVSGRHDPDESIRQYEQLIESSSDLFSIIDADHRYTFCNRAYAALYGLRPEEIVGRHVGDLVGADFFESEVRPYIDCCIAGEPQSIEVDRSYEHLGERRLLIRSYPIPSPDGGTVRAASVLTDITDLRDAETEMRASRDHLEQCCRPARN